MTAILWADDLPRIRAENEAWRRDVLPQGRARQLQQNAERDRCRAIIKRALDAIDASDADRALVLNQTGFAA